MSEYDLSDKTIKEWNDLGYKIRRGSRKVSGFGKEAKFSADDVYYPCKPSHAPRFRSVTLNASSPDYGDGPEYMDEGLIFGGSGGNYWGND